MTWQLNDRVYLIGVVFCDIIVLMKDGTEKSWNESRPLDCWYGAYWNDSQIS